MHPALSEYKLLLKEAQFDMTGVAQIQCLDKLSEPIVPLATKHIIVV